MAHEDRDFLRMAYQREEASASKFIPAKPKIDIYGADKVFRVCAYCRVSTDNDAQLSSFELQQQHYQQLVGNHPNWDLRHIYADDTAIMGLNQNPVQTGVDLVPFFFLSALFSANEGVPA